MRGDLLDVVLLMASVLFALSGYRQGFVVGVLSFLGFLGGGVLGARLAPGLADTGPLAALPRTAVGLAVVFALATVGQVLATVLGRALRRRLTWRPARRVDALAGAAVSVVGLLLVAWLVGRAVADSPYEALSSQVRRSVVIGTVDALVPEAGRELFTSLRELVDERGFPEVFADLRGPTVTGVDPPDPALAASAVVTRARPSVLKITGEAVDCRKRIEGSGFVYARERVMTNAHVVAGVPRPLVEVGRRQLAATVVVFDPGRDLAVLAVPGLDRPALSFDTGTAAAGAGAIVVGYPRDGPFRPNAARISGDQRARGLDIYGEDTVDREIYAVRALVEQGNSGGPLLSLQGQVYGVVFAAAADDTEIGYALTAREVASQAAAGAVATEPVSTRTCD